MSNFAKLSLRDLRPRFSLAVVMTFSKIVTSSEFSRHEKICIEKYSCSNGSQTNFSFALRFKEKPLELTFRIDLCNKVFNCISVC